MAKREYLLYPFFVKQTSLGSRKFRGKFSKTKQTKTLLSSKKNTHKRARALLCTFTLTHARARAHAAFRQEEEEEEERTEFFLNSSSSSSSSSLIVVVIGVLNKHTRKHICNQKTSSS